MSAYIYLVVFILVLAIFFPFFPFKEWNKSICLDGLLFHRDQSHLLPVTGPFCVVKNNKPSHFDSSNLLQSLEVWKNILERERPEEVLLDVVMVLHEDTLRPLELPSALFSDKCTGTQQIVVGRNLTSSCKLSFLTFNETECQYWSAQKFLGPYVVTISKNTTVESPFRSAQDFLPASWLNGTCLNVPTKMDLVFVMNDSFVVDAVVRNLVYTTLDQSNYSDVSLSTTVSFENINAKQIENKGYVKGAPVLLDSEESWTIPSMGNCVDEVGITIPYGVNLHTSCTIRADSCSELQSVVTSLVGSLEALSVMGEPASNRTITPFVHNINATLDKGSNPCSFFNAFSIQVLHALEGPAEETRNVIVAIAVEPHIMKIPFVPNVPVQIQWNLMFMDVTTDAVAQFVSLPHLDLRLPSDFFYPFLANSSPAHYLTSFSTFLLLYSVS